MKVARYGSMTFVFAFIFWYSYPAFLDLLSLNYPLDYAYYIDDETIFLSVVYLTLFLLSGIAASFLSLPSKLKKVFDVPRFAAIRANPRIIILGGLFGWFLGIMIYFYLGGNVSEIVTGILESRAVDKPWLQSSNLGDANEPFYISRF